MRRKILIPLALILTLAFVWLSANAALAKKHHSGKPYIGVYAQSIDEDLQEAFDLSTDTGAVIVDIMENSPADEAGLRRKDIIIKFNGKSVDNSKQLTELVRETNVGDKATVVYIRKGKVKKATIDIGNRPDDTDRSVEKTIIMGNGGPHSFSRTWSFSSGTSGYIGVAIQDLNDQLGKYFGVDDGEGVLITEVFEDSPAEEAGLKAGDVIIRADGEAVAETADLQDIISEKKEGDEVNIQFLRKGTKKSADVAIKEDVLGMNSFTLPNQSMGMNPFMFDKNFHSLFFDDDGNIANSNDNKGEIKELRDELKSMREELREIKEKLKE